jgi:hypothetical protein
MQAPELPPFDYQLVKDRTTKEPATGAGELSGYGIIAWQRRFVRSDDPIFSAYVPPRNQMPTLCWMYWIERLAPSEIIRVPHHCPKIQQQHTHGRTLMRFMAAEERRLTEDNIIVARGGQSVRRVANRG